MEASGQPDRQTGRLTVKINRTGESYAQRVSMVTESRDAFGITACKIYVARSTYSAARTLHLEVQGEGDEAMVYVFAFRAEHKGRPQSSASLSLPLAMLEDALRDLRAVDAPLPTMSERDASTEPVDLDWYATDVMPAAYAATGLPVDAYPY
jgi:hypothetical protein